ncbi:MAG: O-antigen ligase family protein [Anaerolineae bacterium]|nr:O-antigen ligase family protein [Anaerolineae bacterium]
MSRGDLRAGAARAWTAGMGVVLAGLLAAVPLQMAAIVAAVPLGILVAVVPQLLLLGLPLAVPLEQRLSLGLAGIRLGPVELLIGAAVVAWLARAVAARRLSWTAGAVGWALLVWLWVMGLSLTSALSLSAGLVEASKWLEVLALVVVLPALLPRSQVRYLIWALAIAGALSALLGLYQFATGTGPEGFLLLGRFMRAYGTFQQPNPFAAHLGLSLPFAAGWALAAATTRHERLALLTLTGIMVLGILASWSRGAWLALAASVALMAALLRPRLATAGAVLLLITGPLWIGPMASTALAQRALGMTGSVTGLNVARVEPTDDNWAVVERLAHWQAAWYMFEDDPWLGVGAGNYEVVYGRYAVPRWSDPLGHAHNYYLNALAETGLLGLTAYLALGVVAWISLLRGWRSAADSTARALVLAAVGTLAYLTVHSVVDNLYVHGMQVLVGLALAVPVLGRPATDGAPEPKRERCILGL